MVRGVGVGGGSWPRLSTATLNTMPRSSYGMWGGGGVGVGGGSWPRLSTATLNTMPRSSYGTWGGGGGWELAPAFHGYTQHDAQEFLWYVGWGWGGGGGGSWPQLSTATLNTMPRSSHGTSGGGEGSMAKWGRDIKCLSVIHLPDIAVQYLVCSELLFVLQRELEAWPATPSSQPSCYYPLQLKQLLPSLFQGKLLSKVGVVFVA